MPLDGLFLACLVEELSAALANARITRVYQPGKRELSISLRQPGLNHLLHISAHPLLARAHLTSESRDNPKSPPPFCMLLRKYWEGGRLLNISQPGLERILTFECQNIDEFGLTSSTELICEFMGKHSNAILVRKETDGPGRVILGSLIQVYPGMSRVRTVLAGEPYITPPPQEKFYIMNLVEHQGLFRERLREEERKSLKNALVAVLQGIGPLTAEALLLTANLDPGMPVGEMGPPQFSSLWEALMGLKERFLEMNFSPGLIREKGGEGVDFSALPLGAKEQQGFMLTEYTSPSRLLESFYSEKEKLLQKKEHQSLLEQVVLKELNRVQRKLKNQQKELSGAEKGDIYRKQGEVLTAYLYQVKKGDRDVVLPDPYNPQGEGLEIPLDPSLSPSQNAQRYFKKYKKALTAKKELSRRIKATKLEMRYLEGLHYQLEGAENMADLLSLREELAREGYINPQKAAAAKQGIAKVGPLKFKSSDGITIYVGKNNRQNDLLTLKKAGRDDLWFHVKDLPGSHVIVPYASPPYKTLEEAAMLAAYYSGGKKSANVPVDYTRVKNVRKPKGAKPGMVIYDSHKTIYITPSKEKLPPLIPPGS